MHLIIKAKHRSSGDQHHNGVGDASARESDSIPKIRNERQCGEKRTAKFEGHHSISGPEAFPFAVCTRRQSRQCVARTGDQSLFFGL
jgi:hypothetical protein